MDSFLMKQLYGFLDKIKYIIDIVVWYYQCLVPPSQAKQGSLSLSLSHRSFFLLLIRPILRECEWKVHGWNLEDWSFFLVCVCALHVGNIYSKQQWQACRVVVMNENFKNIVTTNHRQQRYFSHKQTFFLSFFLPSQPQL